MQVQAEATRTESQQRLAHVLSTDGFAKDELPRGLCVWPPPKAATGCVGNWQYVTHERAENPSMQLLRRMAGGM